MTARKKSPKTLNVARMEQAGLAAAVEFAEGAGALTLEDILERRLTEESLSLYYPDGSQRKTGKKTQSSRTHEPTNYRDNPPVNTLLW